MRKTIILPVYNDRKNTDGWENRYINDPSLGQLLVYEKDASLENGKSVKTHEGYRVPLIGRSSYAFLCYACDHYENLADVICLTKTHALRQKIFVHESIDHSHRFNHLEFWNNLRVFVWVHPDVYQEYVNIWRAKGLLHGEHDGHCFPAWQPFNKLGLSSFANQTAGEWPVEHPYKMLISSDRWVEGEVGRKMRQVWPDWQVPEVYIGRQEHCWSVKKEVVLQHPKELYLSMRNEIKYIPPEAHESGYWSWGLHHDQWCEFWPLFWDETIKRMK